MADVVCNANSVQLSDSSFLLTVDHEAFQSKFMGKHKALSVSRLSLDGTWLDTVVAPVFEDDFIRVAAGGAGGASGAAAASVLLTVKRPVDILVVRPRATKNLLCRKGSQPYLYVRMLFDKQPLPRGTYHMKDHTALAYGGDRPQVSILNVPDKGSLKPEAPASSPSNAVLLESFALLKP